MLPGCHLPALHISLLTACCLVHGMQALSVLLEQGADLTAAPVGSCRTYGSLALEVAAHTAPPGATRTTQVRPAPPSQELGHHAMSAPELRLT